MADVKIPVDESTITQETQSQPATKSAIIDRELNRHGMGRYQWLIWVMCGTGFLLDGIWTQAVGLVWSDIQREFGFSDKDFGKLSTAITVGIAVGAFFWGVLVDIVGRRVAFLGTSLIAGVFGMCIGAQSSYNGLIVFMAFTAIGVGGNIPMDATIASEYIPEVLALPVMPSDGGLPSDKDRFYLLPALTILSPLGTVLCGLTAFGFITNYSCPTKMVSCNLTGGVTPCCSRDTNMGWRYLFFTVASIMLSVFVIRFFIFPFYESPRFLLSKGNDRGAVEVVQKIAAFNNRPCDLTVESLREQCKEDSLEEEMGFSERFVSEISRTRLLFGSWRMARVTIIVWIIWMSDYWGMTITGTYLPTILLKKNSAINVSVKQTYIDYLIAYTPGFFAAILTVLMFRAPMVGRKWTLVFSSMVMGMSLFLYSIVDTQASFVGFNVLAYFCQTLFNAALYGWTPEAFPPAVRGTATGLASFFGSLLSICAPPIAAQLFGSTNGSNAVLYLAGSGVFVCTIAVLCLPTRGMVAPR